MVPYRSSRPLRGCTCTPAQPMGELGLSLFSKFLKISTPGPNEFKLQTTPKEVKKVIAVAGPVLGLIPGYGKLAAAGAAIITAADQRQKAQALQNAGNDANALLQAYSQIAGQVPGRAIGLPMLKNLIDAFGKTGGWPNVKRWNTASASDIFDGCRGCTPPTIPDFVRAQLSTTTDPQAMVGPWNAHVNQNWGSKWFVGTAGGLQNQLITDVFDYEVSQLAPNAPQTYAIPASDQPVATSPVPPQIVSTPMPSIAPPLPAPAIPSSQLPPGVTLGAQIGFTTDGTPVFAGSDGQRYVVRGGTLFLYPGAVLNAPPGGGSSAATPAPSTSPSSAITSPTVPPEQTPALIQQLLAQGASSQQAFAAALQSLAAQGIAATPQVQQQVAQDVAKAAPSTMGLGNVSPTVLAIGAGLLALSFALARPAKRGKRR